MGETSGSNVFNGSQDSFFVARFAEICSRKQLQKSAKAVQNEARLAQVHQVPRAYLLLSKMFRHSNHAVGMQDVVDMMESKGPRIPVPARRPQRSFSMLNGV